MSGRKKANWPPRASAPTSHPGRARKPARPKSEPAEEILQVLPEEPPDGLTEHLWDVASDELGGWIIGFKRESITVAPPIKKTMDWNDWEEHERNTHKRWAASCICSCCGSDFVAGWPKRAHKSKGIVAKIVDDAYMDTRYMEDVGWVSEDEENAEFLMEGETVCCPFCGVAAELVKIGAFRKGRTYAIQAGAVEVHGGYAMLVYYLATRYLVPSCDWIEEIRPREALVIDKAGRLRRFSHTKYGDCGEADLGCWKEQSIMNPEERPFYTWGTGKGRKRLGAIWFDRIPDLKGTTGEKTGLDDYLGLYNFEDPGVYWMIWRKRPYIENLVRAGWRSFVCSCISRATEIAMGYGHPCRMEDLPYVDLSEAKPSKQLRMSREEVREAAAFTWNRDQVALWMETREKYPRIRPKELNEAMRKFTTRGLNHILAMADDGWPNFELTKVLRYLSRQKGLHAADACQTFVDYRTMLESAALGEQPTEEQLWPPHLRDAHDRLSTQLSVSKSQKYIAEFQKLKQKYRPLEWTDGELCIVVPESNADLVTEGMVLHHCVGGYGEKHVEGRSIFFVRKYRRPERSYYTLNEDLTGMEPFRIQLHGYRNEYNDDGSMHSIPKKVLDFVSRWEKEILTPWFYQQPEIQARAERKKRKEKNAA